MAARKESQTQSVLAHQFAMEDVFMQSTPSPPGKRSFVRSVNSILVFMNVYILLP